MTTKLRVFGAFYISALLIASAYSQDHLTKDDSDFLASPFDNIALCTDRKSTTYYCGSGGVLFEAQMRASSPDPKVRKAAAEALTLALLASAFPLNNKVTCGGSGGCTYVSKTRCGTSDPIKVGMIDSGIRRALGHVNRWADGDQARLQNLVVQEGRPQDFGFGIESKKIMRTGFSAELTLIGDTGSRRVSVNVGWATTCGPDDYLELDALVTIGRSLK